MRGYFRDMYSRAKCRSRTRRQRKARALSASPGKTGVGAAELGRGQCTCDNNNNNARDEENVRGYSRATIAHAIQTAIVVANLPTCPPYKASRDSRDGSRLHHDGFLNERGRAFARWTTTAFVRTRVRRYIEPTTTSERDEPLARQLACRSLRLYFEHYVTRDAA